MKKCQTLGDQGTENQRNLGSAYLPLHLFSPPKLAGLPGAATVMAAPEQFGLFSSNLPIRKTPRKGLGGSQQNIYICLLLNKWQFCFSLGGGQFTDECCAELDGRKLGIGR